MEKNPRYSPAILRLGIIALMRGLFSKAEEKFLHVLQCDNYNLGVYYFLGLTYKFKDNISKAKDAFWNLSLDKSYLTIASFVELGKIALMERNYGEAIDLLEKAFSRNVNNPKVGGLYTAALRNAGKINEAKKVIDGLLLKEPLDGLVLNEYLLLNGTGRAKEVFNRLIKRIPENSIELSIDYIQAGLFDEAAEILNKAKQYFASYPLIYYYLGFIYEKKGKLKKARKNYFTGATRKCKKVFPWQLESIEILENAIKHFPHLPNTYEYLGNFMFYVYRYEEGLKNFYRAKELGSSSSIVFRNIALGHLRVKLAHRKMAKAYLEAVNHAPCDWELYYEADRFLAAYGYLNIRKKIASKITNKVLEHPKAMERKAKLYVDMSMFNKAMEFVKDKDFYPWEGEFLSRQIYEDAYNGKAEILIRKKKYDEALKYINLAMEYPTNLGVLKYKERIECRSMFLQGIIEKTIGRDKNAGKYWDRILSKGINDKFVCEMNVIFYFPSERIFFSSLVLAEYGKVSSADRILRKILSICRKSYNNLLQVMSFLEEWRFLKNFKKVTPCKTMLCGYKIPAVHQRFLKEIAAMCNKRRGV